MDFVTLGMLIIDDIYYPIPRLPSRDVLGGAGSYAALGARLIAGEARSRAVGWTIHEGDDFPEALEEQIASWETNCNWIRTPHRLTTRGLNVYKQSEVREFEYTSPKIRIDQSTLTNYQLQARSFHLICSPTRCINLVEGILARRKNLYGSQMDRYDKPIFVWEPVPDLCTPSERSSFLEAIKHVDVMSPNFEELGRLLSLSLPTHNDLRLDTLATVCRSLLFATDETLSKSQLSCIIVRMGGNGCLVADKFGVTMIGPYHASPSSGTVVDPTGAGNAFLGGFCIGLTIQPPHEFDDFRTTDKKYLMGALSGTVAASFAIEQVGMPTLSRSPEGQELWNNDSVSDRIQRLAVQARGSWITRHWQG